MILSMTASTFAADDFAAALRQDHGLGADDPRPVIEVRRGDLDRLVREAIAALKADGTKIFDRGGVAVRPVRLATPEVDHGIARDAGAMVLRPVSAAWLTHALARVAAWVRRDARAGEWRPTDPPERVAAILADAPDLAAWPPIRAVVRHPLVMPNGEIIAAPGYHAPTGILVDVDNEWSIPETIDRDAARDACDRLLEVLRHYPWATRADQAVALSLLVTALARPVLPAAPMHVITSPEPGCGKSMLADVAAILATGAHAPVMTWPEGRDADAESAKRIDAAQLAGDQIIAIDNIERPLEGAALAQLLTQGARRIRLLGASTAVTVACTAMVVATGINLLVRGDLTRRTVVSRLDPGLERPELRQIDQDLLAEVRARRRDLVIDALTIPVAYLRAGTPDVGVPPLGGYDAWSRMVRQALVWLGETDPCNTMERTREDDTRRAATRAVYAAWHAALGEAPVTVADLLAQARQDPDLAAALRDAFGDDVTARGVGAWCAYHRDRRVDGLVLRDAGISRTRARRWLVERA